MLHKIYLLICTVALFSLFACGKKAQKNEDDKNIKKDSVKTEKTKTEKSSVQKLGLNIPKDTYTYYGRQKNGYQLLAVGLDKETYKPKAIYFKDIDDKDLQPCDIISNKNQGDNDIMITKTKDKQKEIKITFPIMGDINVNGKMLVPATIFTSNEDKRILTTSGSPMFMPFLIGESFNDLEEIKVNYPEKNKHPKYGTVSIWFKGKNRGKNVEVIVPSTEKFDKIVLVENGTEIHFNQYE